MRFLILLTLMLFPSIAEAQYRVTIKVNPSYRTARAVYPQCKTVTKKPQGVLVQPTTQIDGFRETVGKPVRRWPNQRIYARWTWPGYPYTANLRKHLAEPPHNLDTSNMSNSQIVNYHNREHDRIGPVSGRQLQRMKQAPEKTVVRKPAPQKIQRSTNGMWYQQSSPRYCPPGRR
jgi:hypothetical protein